MTVGLQFDPTAHKYTLDGEPVDGVTTILSQAIPKPALPKWAAKSVAEWVASNPSEINELYRDHPGRMVARLKEIPFKVSERATVRGTDLHDLAERHLLGQDVSVPEHLTGHFRSVLDFLADWEIEPVLVEATVGSREHKYAGKFDLIADSARAERAIFDWKTNKSGIYFETAFQLNAYAFAEFHGENGVESPMADLGIKDAYAVQIRADGYEVVPMKFGPDIFAEFVHLMNAARIISRAAGDWRVPGTGYRGVGIKPNSQRNH